LSTKLHSFNYVVSIGYPSGKLTVLPKQAPVYFAS